LGIIITSRRLPRTHEKITASVRPKCNFLLLGICSVRPGGWGYEVHCYFCPCVPAVGIAHHVAILVSPMKLNWLDEVLG
jgi:hypothetical protein